MHRARSCSYSSLQCSHWWQSLDSSDATSHFSIKSPKTTNKGGQSFWGLFGLVFLQQTVEEKRSSLIQELVTFLIIRNNPFTGLFFHFLYDFNPDISCINGQHWLMSKPISSKRREQHHIIYLRKAPVSYICLNRGKYFSLFNIDLILQPNWECLPVEHYMLFRRTELLKSLTKSFFMDFFLWLKTPCWGA